MEAMNVTKAIGRAIATRSKKIIARDTTYLVDLGKSSG